MWQVLCRQQGFANHVALLINPNCSMEKSDRDTSKFMDELRYQVLLSHATTGHARARRDSTRQDTIRRDATRHDTTRHDATRRDAT